VEDVAWKECSGTGKRSRMCHCQNFVNGWLGKAQSVRENFITLYMSNLDLKLNVRVACTCMQHALPLAVQEAPRLQFP
jgi:hypothetical protein